MNRADRSWSRKKYGIEVKGRFTVCFGRGAGSGGRVGGWTFILPSSLILEGELSTWAVIGNMCPKE